MVWEGYFVVEVLSAAVLAFALLRRYAERSTHWVYSLVVGTSWALGFFGTILFPLDYAVARSAGSHSSVFDGTWSVVYWSTFVSTWVFCPFLQEFYNAGHFTTKAKVLESLRKNLLFYAALGVLAIAFVIWMAIESTMSSKQLFNLMITAANTWGIIIVLVLLGYGLVEVPKWFFSRRNPEAVLQRLEFQAVEVESKCFDAECDLDDVRDEIRQLRGLVANQPEFEAKLELLTDKLPRERAVDRAGRSGGADRTEDTETNLGKRLVAVHARLNRAIVVLHRSAHRWNELVDHSERLHHIINGDTPSPPSGASRWGRWGHNTAWRFRHSVQRPLYVLLSVLLGLVSIIVLWSEITIGIDKNLSPFGLLIEGSPGFFLQQLLVLLPLAYVSACTYFSVFRIRLFGFVDLSSGRHTDAYSLLFNAAFLCRLQFSLVYNYMSVLHLEDASDLAFQRTIGQRMELVAMFDFLPILCAVVALASAFDVFERLLRMMGVDATNKPRAGNIEHDTTMREGRALIQRHLQRRSRAADSMSRSLPDGASHRTTYTPPSVELNRI